MEEPRPTVSKSLDDNLYIGTVYSECSLTASERQEHIGEDLSEDTPGGVRLPLDGRAMEHTRRRGEEKMVLDCPDDERLSKIRSVLNATGYASLSYIARETGLSAEDVEALIGSHPEEVRQSLMRAENGEEVYMINTPLSSISDAWKAFRYLNAKMF